MFGVRVIAVLCAGLLLAAATTHRSIALHAQAAQSPAETTTITPDMPMFRVVKILAGATRTPIGFESVGTGEESLQLAAPIDVRGMNIDAALDAIIRGSDDQWERVDGDPVVFEKAHVSDDAGNILSQLPTLPDGLEYRFLGRHLILLDTRANMILDRIPYAIYQSFPATQ